MIVLFRRALTAALLASALLAPTASAAPDQLSFMMDDDMLLYRDDNTRAQSLVRMKSLGADAVRVTVLWRTVARGVNHRSKRFDADDPGTYPTRNWDRFDNLVTDARRIGLDVLFNVTGPGPSYGHRKPPRSQRDNRLTYKPFAGRFRDFVEAVGKRYSGTFVDENGTKAALPRVRLWSIWNEPNQAGWLTPQWEPKGKSRTRTPASPALYRELYHFGHEALVDTGHGGDAILLGETAPLGSSRKTTRSPMRPERFMRELVCADSKGRRYRGATARRRDCGDFTRRGPLKTTGFAHHPYTKERSPTRKPQHDGELTMANIPELTGLLDGLAGSTKRIPANLPIFMTEFGYESSPPDPHNGISLDRQAEFNQLGEFLAHQNPRVKGITQFLLRDVGPVRKHKRGSKAYWFTYQSGLFTQRGQPKPAAFAYALPFIAFPGANNNVGFWGQLRFRPNRVGDTATIQWRPAKDTGAWMTLGPPVPTNANGFFTASRPLPGPGGEYRAVYLNPVSGGVELFSLSTEP